jgi:hypothetical protein
MRLKMQQLPHDDDDEGRKGNGGGVEGESSASRRPAGLPERLMPGGRARRCLRVGAAPRNARVQGWLRGAPA